MKVHIKYQSLCLLVSNKKIFTVFSDVGLCKIREPLGNAIFDAGDLIE